MKTKSLNKKSGISLIVLVITIIVIIILAVAVILSIANNNPIENANKAKFQSDLKTMQEELELIKQNNYVESQGKDYGELDFDTLTGHEKYSGKFIISEGNLKYLPSKLNEKEQEWAKEIGITAGGYELEDGTDGVEINGGTLFASTYTGTETDIIIPKDVSMIGMNAFSGCSTLSSVIISNSVRGIDEMAFSGCTSLTSVTMSNNLGSIGIAAFSGCTSLTSVTIPSSVTAIRDGAFFGCTNLTITISESTAKTCFGDTATEDSVKTTLGVKAVVFK